MNEAMFIGIDSAVLPSYSSAIITGVNSAAFSPGDKITTNGFPNRIRHTVSSLIDARSLSLNTWGRPSRGYAKHRRKQKARNEA